jgi:hypothetical protein
MRHALAVCVFSLTSAFVHGALAQQASGPACGDPGCGAASIAKTPSFPAQIPREGDFAADVEIKQPCSCTRRLSLVVSFTPKGSSSSRERAFDIDAAPGTSTTHIALPRAELAKLKVKPGRHTVSFALLDEQQKHFDAAGVSLAGLPFTFGKSAEQLVSKPIVPAAIAKGAVLAVPFHFKNTGDISTAVSALLAFTRPDTDRTIEFYKENLAVAPGQVTHVVSVSAAKRKELGVGAGAWLVTTAAFDGNGNKLESYPGQLLMIGKVLSVPVPPKVSSPIASTEDLSVDLTLENTGDVEDLVTALLVFSRPDVPKAIEHKVEGIHVPVGTSTHTIVLSAQDRFNIGIRPGRWHVSATALDRAGKRLELVRGNDAVIGEGTSTALK